METVIDLWTIPSIALAATLGLAGLLAARLLHDQPAVVRVRRRKKRRLH